METEHDAAGSLGGMADGSTFERLGGGWRAWLRLTLRTVAAQLWLYHRRHCERAQLLALTERERRDIGISRLDAVREAGKPFWR